MPFNLQTDNTSGNTFRGHTLPYAPLVDSIERSRAKVRDSGHNIKTGPTIERLKQALPKYERFGGPNLIYSITNSSDDDQGSMLNRITKDLLETGMEMDDSLVRRYEENPELRQTDFIDLRDRIRNSVLQETYTGEDIATSISNRSLDLRVDREESRSTVGRKYVPGTNFSDKYDESFVDRVGEISDNLGIDKNYLFAVMDFETGGSFSPSAKNPESTATGLIQFLESTANELGTSTDNLAKMDSLQQLDYVERYLENVRNTRGELETLEDLYMAVLWPAAVGRDKNDVLWEQGSESYEVNSKLDRGNKGHVTVGDATEFVRNRFEGNTYVLDQELTERPERRFTREMNIPVSEYLDIAKNRPERYANLIDEHGNVKFTTEESGREEFKSYLRAHPNILESLERDRYDNFKSELAKRHNVGPMIENDPDHLARAYAVYDRFGPEGLTQYSNYFEEFDPNLPKDRQNQKFVRAHNFLENERVDGLSPREWMYVFTGEEGTPFGKFQVSPVKESIYTQVQFPKGWNTYTANSYDYNIEEGVFNRKDNFSQVQSLFQSYSDRDPTTDEINYITEDIGGDAYNDLVWDVRRNASVVDLIDNLKANLDYDENSAFPRYVISNVDNLPIETQVAVDALRTMNEFENAFYRTNLGEGIDGGEDLVFEPNRTDRIRGGEYSHNFSPARAFNTLLQTEEVPIKDQSGNVVGYEEAPARGFWNQFWNTGVGVSVKALEYYKDYFLDPAAWAITRGIEQIDQESASSFDAFWEDTFGEWDAYELDNFFTFRENTVPRLAMLGMDFVNFFRAFKAYGTAGIWTAGKFAKKINDISKGRELARVHMASQFGRSGRDYGKWETMLNSMGRGLAQSDRRLLTAQIALGDALIQPVTEGDIGFFKHGILGEEAEEWYKRSDYFTRTFADVAFNSVVGFAGDALFSSAGAVRAVRKADTGKKMDAAYRSLFTAEGDSYFAEFLNFMSDNANAIPEGQILDSAVNAFRGRAFMLDKSKVDTLADVVYSIKHDASGYLSNIRSDIRETLKHYDIKFTGKTRNNLEEDVERIYRESIDQTATHLERVVRERSGNISGLSSAYQLGRLFEQHSGQLREVVEVGQHRAQQGRVYSLSEANKIAAEGPNRIVRREPDVAMEATHAGDRGTLVSDKYRVFESSDESWGLDLGRALKRKAIDDDVSKAASRRMEDIRKTQERDPTSSEVQEITETVGEIFGAPFQFGGRTGYVTDKLPDGKYMVRMDDGTLAKANVPKEQIQSHFNHQRSTGQIDEEEYLRLVRKFDVADADATYAWWNAKVRVDLDMDAHLSRESQQALFAAQYDAVQQYHRVTKNGAEEFLSNNINRFVEPKRLPARGETTGAVPDDVTRWGFGKRVLQQIQGWTGATQTATKATMLHIARNLGVDSYFTFSARDAKGRRIFGINKGDITDWEPLPSGNAPTVKKGTLVYHGDIHGVPRIFHANKKTKTPPSRWIADPQTGKPIRNPDWDQMSPNVTIDQENKLSFFIRDDDTGLYRPVRARDGEFTDAVALNIQHPIKGGKFTRTASDKFEEGLTDEHFIVHGYDAVEYTVDGQSYFRLVDEGSQAVDPRLMAADNMSIADVVNAVPTSKIHEAGMGGAIKGTLLGGFAGSVASGLTEEYDASELGGLGSIAGLAIGLLAGPRTRSAARTVTTSIKEKVPHVKRVTNQTEKDPHYYEPGMKKAVEDSEAAWKKNQAVGYEGDIRERAEVSAYSSMLKTFESFVAAGGDALEFVASSKFTQSPIQMFKKMKSRTGSKLGDILYKTDGEPRKWMANIQRQYNSKQGRNAWEEDKQYLNNLADEFLTSQGVDVRDTGIQRFIGRGNAAYEQWNEATVRIITGEAKIQGNQLVYNGRQNITDVYNGPNGAAYRAFDEHLLRDKKFTDRIEAIREGYRNTRKRTLQAYHSKLEQELTSLRKVDPEHARVLSKFAQTTDNYQTYLKSIVDDKEKKLLREAINKTEYGRSIRDIQSSKSKFTDQGDAYVTQLHSKNKMQEYQRRWVEAVRRDNPEMTPQEADQAFRDHTFDEFRRLNAGKEGNPRFFETDTNELRTVTENSRDRVKTKLHSIIEQAPSDVRPVLLDRVDDMITDLGPRTRDGKTVNMYGIRNPIDQLERDAFTHYNDLHMKNLFNNVMDGIVIRNSNFLERPRNYELPFHWMETDMEGLLRRYARDTQPRLMWMEEGVFNLRDFKRNFSKRISDELRAANVDQTSIDRNIGRINSIFNMQTGMAHRLAAMSGMSHADKVRQLHRLSNWEKLSSFVRNINFIPFAYYISVYDTFQPFIHGAMLSSMGSMASTSKTFLTNPTRLNNAEELTKLWGASMPKIEAYHANFQRDFADVVGPTAFDRRMGKMDNLASRGADASARISFTKGVMWAGNKLTGGLIRPDIANWGMARLALDDFLGVNSVSTTMNWYAGMLEAQRLSTIHRQFANNPDRIQIQGMTRADVDRKFGLIGIPENRIERFVKQNGEWDELIEQMGRKDFNMSFFDQPGREGLFNDLGDMITHMTDSYHGKSRMFRPESWSSEVGRVLSQYKIYPFNFAMQNFNRRIADPIRAWDSQFGQNIGAVEVGKIMSRMVRNDMKGLRAMGLSDDAINAFPVESYKSILKVLYAVNASAAMFITRDAMMDIMEIPFLSEEDQWARMQRRGIVNPNAPQDQQKTWADLVSGSGFEHPSDFFTVLRGYGEYATRTGTFGIYGDFLENSRLQRDGIAQLTIAGNMTNEFVKSAARIMDSDPANVPNTVGREVFSHTLQRTPVMGSLGAGRRAILGGFEAEVNKPKYQNIRFVDSRTGNEIDRSLLYGTFD